MGTETWRVPGLLRVCFAAFVTLGGAAAEAPSQLFYDKPSVQWTDALPLGNGRIGAMVFGGIANERIQINESTLWGGGPHNYVNRQAGGKLDELRRVIFEGKTEEAGSLASRMMGQPPVLMPYQPLCDLRLQFDGKEGVAEYRRVLSLNDATAAVSYRIGKVRFRREMFVSHPGQVMVVRLTSDRAGQQNVLIGMDSPQPGTVTTATAESSLQLTGQIQPRQNTEGSWTGSWTEPGMRYAAYLNVRASGGTVVREGDRLRVRGADAVTIVFSGATSFRNYRDIGGDALGRARAFVDAASNQSYQKLRMAHLADYRKLFARVSLQLGAGQVSTTTTDVRIRNFKSANDPALAALYYQFGRYLLISSSRPGGQPANLQGIWNEELVPAWSSKWTTNINLEMNYWPAETGDLWETEEPLWDLIDDLRVTGAETARVHYGAGGWVLHHNTDIWRATTPVDGPWGIWPMGSVWLANQMWDHYEYGADKSFLRKHAYPAMKGAVRFVLDTLVEAPKGARFAGHLVTNPSMSPENQYLLNGKSAHLTYAATMDVELVAELFKAFRKASRILETDAALVAEVDRTEKRLPPLQIGGRGQLQEWIDDYGEAEPDHRHVSHLWSLYPGHGITLRGTPELAAAARRSLELRGDGGTGWAMAWKTALWARLGDGDHAYRLLKSLISDSTLPNMFDVCPPFQIDGNFGGAAAIAEMLMQSDGEEILLLPALPSSWPQGKVTGLRARGGVKVDIEWQDHRLTAATLTSDNLRNMRVRLGGVVMSAALPARKPMRLNGALRLGDQVRQ